MLAACKQKVSLMYLRLFAAVIFSYVILIYIICYFTVKNAIFFICNIKSINNNDEFWQTGARTRMEIR